jgi:serine/threonine protein kinase
LNDASQTLVFMSRGADLIGKTILKNYVIRKRLGGGSFGDVYQADDMESQQVVAIKIEVSGTTSQLNNEYRIYQWLAGMDGIPKVYGLHDYGRNRAMVMEQMGSSLEVLFRRCGKQFSLKTVLMIADQIFRIMQWVHHCGIVHRDIKPHNFVTGRGEFRNKLYLIDFGVSTAYLDHRSHEHKDYSRHNGLVGTAQYVSINTHLGDQQSRRDDIESVMYVLIRFLRGKLPWSDVKDKDAETRNEKITQSKIHTTLDSLCTSIPNEFKEIMDDIRRTGYEVMPKYAWMRQVLHDLFLRCGFVYDGVFDWDDAAPIHKPIPGVYLRQYAGEFQFINERHAKAKKRVVDLPVPRAMFISPWG